jgi:hypothetical protein
MLDAFVAVLEARSPEQGRFRAYRLEAGTDLLGEWLVQVTYGRIGARGRRVQYVVADETEARRLVGRTLRRRAGAPKRIGVAYQFCELRDPNRWVAVSV